MPPEGGKGAGARRNKGADVVERTAIIRHQLAHLRHIWKLLAPGFFPASD